MSIRNNKKNKEYNKIGVFTDSNGEFYNFLMFSKILPITVVYGLLNPPG